MVLTIDQGQEQPRVGTTAVIKILKKDSESSKNIEPFFLRETLRRCGLDKGCLGTVRLPNRNMEEGQSRDLLVTLARKPQHVYCPPDHRQIKSYAHT